MPNFDLAKVDQSLLAEVMYYLELIYGVHTAEDFVRAVRHLIIDGDTCDLRDQVGELKRQVTRLEQQVQDQQDDVRQKRNEIRQLQAELDRRPAADSRGHKHKVK